MKDTTKMAFPTTYNENDNVQEGMTLRDYFAAKAMQAQIGNTNSLYVSDEPSRVIMAKRAYWMADAMMEARK